jgi:CMP-N,N'-diacetyllegionaminic acid synthase
MIAIVPVRKGSERVPNKNIKDFAGSSLLELKLQQLQRVDLFKNVVVSSDCNDMLNMAIDLDATPHKRNPEFCEPGTSMRDVYKYLGHEFKGSDAIAYINVTNPLLSDESLVSCVQAYKNRSPETISVNTIHEVKDFMWHDGSPVNYDPYDQPRSQDLPNYYALNFACNIIRTDVMMHQGIVVGTPHIGIIIDKIQAMDIDDIYDFEIAETLYKQKLLKARGMVR